MYMSVMWCLHSFTAGNGFPRPPSGIHVKYGFKEMSSDLKIEIAIDQLMSPGVFPSLPVSCGYATSGLPATLLVCINSKLND